jgi:hypothetical protein
MFHPSDKHWFKLSKEFFNMNCQTNPTRNVLIYEQYLKYINCILNKPLQTAGIARHVNMCLVDKIF